MAFILSYPLSLVAVIALIASFFLYRAAKPKPLPGIPYVRASADSILGDVPGALAHYAETGEMVAYLEKQLIQLNSPIAQVFMRPFSKPWVVLSDAREAQDIMARRTHEFDRSEFLGDLLTAVLPHNQVHMKTNEQWRSNRRLMADTMSPSFLHNAAGPRFYDAWTQLVKLWTEKARLAAGHAFPVMADVSETMLDAILGTTFGSPPETVRSQLELLSGIHKLDSIPKDSNAVVELPHAPVPDSYHMILAIIQSSEIPMHSPFGRTHHKFATRFYPGLSRAMRWKTKFLGEKLQSAYERFIRPDASEDDVKSAIDLIVARETALAKKEGRSVSHDSPYVRDELFGFLEAGHDTTGTTVQWGLKLLTQSPGVQHSIREGLRKAFPHAARSNEIPSAQDIAQAHLPYLEACIKEILRCGGTVVANTRVSTQDTEVLGCQIPRGTDVFMLTQGPSYRSPALPIAEGRRSKTSQQMDTDTSWSGNWDENDLAAFRPERWLVKNEGDEFHFDSRAGPMQIFGGGLRGCFGKKLAHLGLRIVFTLIVWNFELQALPEALSDMKGRDVLTHGPQHVHLRLKPLF